MNLQRLWQTSSSKKGDLTKMNYELRPYQDRAMRETLDFFKHRHKSALVVLPTGCHAKGESVLLANGNTIKVEDVRVGDELMGEDGSKRTVLCLHHGEDDLYKVVPKKGDPFVVNRKHMLTLQKTKERKIAKYPCQVYDDSYIDIPIEEYILLSKSQKHLLKLVHTKGVCFEKENENDLKITISPYFLGMLLGDGGLSNGRISFTTMDKVLVDEVNAQAKKYGFDYRTSPSGKATTYYFKNSENQKGASILANELKELGLLGHTSGEKFIPQCYKMASKENRLEILAGLIDTDGHLTINSYDFTTKSKQLAEDIAFLCRSVGLRVYMVKCKKTIKKLNFVGTYYRLSISGDVSIIPCKVKIAEKRKQIKSWHRSGFEIEPIGKGEYFGFTVDKDNRYLLPDFTITHNCGKTSVMSAIAEVVSKNGGKVLFLAHRTTLVTQGAKAIEKATGIKVGKDRGKDEIPSESIIVSTVQAMSKDTRLEKYGPEFFNLIMIDESHHIPASSYQKVISYFTKARILGVTATPKRGDHTDVTDIFESVSSEYTMYEAISDGWLSPIKTQTCPVQIDVSKCEMQSGDYSVSDIGEALKPYMENIVDQIIEKSGNRKTIIFVPLVATAKSVVEMFRARGVDADYVAGERKDSDDVLKAYHNGEFRILINSLLLTEGYDEPSISCVVNLRLTKSEALYTQIIGRGTRLSPETGKKDLLVLDFLWKDKEKRKHLNAKSVVAAGDASISDEDLDDIQRACECIDEEPTDVFEGIEKAKKDVRRQREEALARAIEETNRKQEEEEKKRKQREDQIRALGEAREEIIKGGKVVNVGDHLSIVYDEFGSMVLCAITNDEAVRQMGLSDYYPEGYSWEFAPPTDNQMKALMRLGFPVGYVASKGHCSFLMNALFDREKRGLCSYKQIKLLSRYKLGDLSMCSREKAKKGMDILSKNGWRPTNELYAVFNGKEFTASDATDTSNIEIC